MKIIEILKKLNEIDKTYFTINDLKKIININKDSLKVKINRLVKQNVLKRIIRGIYVPYNKAIDFEFFSVNYVIPSYISFEYALSKYGLISEIPYEITLATLKRTKKFKAQDITINYRRIQKRLFFGYKKLDNIFIATKEKAFLDCAYLKLNGKQISIDINKVNIRKLNKKIILDYLKKYTKKVKKYVINIIELK